MKAVMRDKAELKDSGIEWIGEIPDDWRVSVLFQVTTQVKNKNSDLNEQNLLSLSYGKIKRKDINGNEGLLPASFENYNVVEKDDIVLRLTDLQNDHKSLRVGHVDERGIITSAYVTLHPNEFIKSEYLYYVLHTFDLKKGFYGMGAGVRQGLTYDEVKTLKLCCPLLNEQQAIANYLDDRCSKIDAIIAEAKASIEEYKELKQAVIYEAVTKGLDKNAPMKDSGVPAISKINSGFQIGKIGELQSGLTDGTHGTYARHSSGQLLLSSKNVQQEGLVIGNNESYISEEDYQAVVANGFPMKNDILLCCIGASIGRCILYEYDYPIAFQRSVIFIRTNKWMLPKFMLYSLQSPSTYMQENVIINQSAQAGLYQGLVKQIYVVVPPIEEQENIVDYLDNITSKIDALISEKQSLIEELESYKKSLIYEVVTGKRKVVE